MTVVTVGIVTSVPPGVDPSAPYPLAAALTGAGLGVGYVDPGEIVRAVDGRRPAPPVSDLDLDLDLGLDLNLDPDRTAALDLDPYDLLLIRTTDPAHLPPLSSWVGERRCVNALAAMVDAADKWRTATILREVGVPVPRTALAATPDEIDAAIGTVGRPALLKPRLGSRGRGIVVVQDSDDVARVLAERGRGVAEFVLQEYVQMALPTDYRAFVVGGRAVAWMRRESARPGELTNLALGGRGSVFAAEPAWDDLATAAAHALRLDIAGVDILGGPAGPLVLEVNSVPGFRGISAHTQVDVCGAIARHVQTLLSGA